MRPPHCDKAGRGTLTKAIEVAAALAMTASAATDAQVSLQPAAPVAPAAQANPPAAAPDTSDARVSYDRSFYGQFQPNNALQIVERIPGFTLDIGSETTRGFGQAAGNVVINGQRPSNKRDSLAIVLQRIPAARVLRVEIGRGNLFGAEYAGRAQVLNVILAEVGGLAGSVEATVRRDFRGRLYPEGSVSALLKRGRSTFNASTSIANPTVGTEGPDRLETLPDRATVETRFRQNRGTSPTGTASASWEFADGENRILHVNASGAIDRLRLRQANDILNPDSGPRRDPLTSRSDASSYELGGDVTRPLLGGGVKLIALATRRSRDVLDRVDSIAPAGPLGGFEQSIDERSEESLARLVWTRGKLLGFSVEIGAEGAYNRLRSRVDLFDIDPAGARARIDQAVDDATVSELRGEAFVDVGRALTTRLRLDAGVTVERSRLRVTGDAQARRDLTFVKPRATLDWQAGRGWHLQASVKRTVAQLQFEDFISGTDLNAEVVSGGNANLQPQRAWEALAFVEKPILGDGSVRLEVQHDRISLLQDRVPTASGFDAPGNLGDATATYIRAKADVPLARLGFAGARLTLSATYAATRVADPFTARDRRFSGNSPFFWEATFRRDGKSFAWGATLSGEAPSTVFRLDEEDRLSFQNPYAVVFAEWRPAAKTAITLTLDNAIDSFSVRGRTFFFPNRGNPVPELFERRQRNKHLVPQLTIKHSFD